MTNTPGIVMVTPTHDEGIAMHHDTMWNKYISWLNRQHLTPRFEYTQI